MLQARGTWAQYLLLRGLLLCGMWDLPGPGIEFMPPEFLGRFSTTGPPGKSLSITV